jgi:hypothetical protein
MTDRVNPADPNEEPNAAQSAAEDSAPADRVGDLARLERGVRKLVEQLQATQLQNQELQRDLETRESRVHELEAEVLAVNQRRQDALKRIDDLVQLVDRVSRGSGTAFDATEEPGEARAGNGGA